MSEQAEIGAARVRHSLGRERVHNSWWIEQMKKGVDDIEQREPDREPKAEQLRLIEEGREA